MNRVVVAFLSLMFIGSISFAQPINRIDDILAKKLMNMNDHDIAQVIVVLSDQVDVNAMHRAFRATRASKDERHFIVVTALRQKASATQGPLLDLLSTRQRAGEVESYEPMWIVNMVLARVTKGTVLLLSTRDDIGMIYDDGLLTFDAPIDQAPAGSIPGSAEPNLRVINAHKLWQLGFTGEGSLVMNIDTGVNGAHPALGSKWRGNLPGVQWYHAWYDQKIPPSPVPVDYGSTKHGSHTMGIMMGLDVATADTIGVAPGALWIASPTIDVGFSPHTSYTLRAFQWAADPDSNVNTSDDVPDVISNSYQDPNVSGTECTGASGYWAAIDAVEAIGTAVVFSAGNAGPGAQTITPPKNRITTDVNIFAVGNLNTSTSPPWVISNSSSRGPSRCDGVTFKPEVVAPGTSIRSALGGSTYGNLSGTSMAAPHVGGAIALLRSIAPALTGTEIKEILYNTAIDYGTLGEDNTYGKGLIDLWAAYQVLPLNLGHVRGLVTAQGNPLSGVQINFVENVQQIGGTTGSDGMYLAAARIDTPNTTALYTLRAQKFGYLTYTDTITLRLSDTVTRNFTMQALDLVLTKTNIAFSSTPIPGSRRDSLVARNQGVGTLTLSSLTTTNSDFSVSPTSGSIAPGDSLMIHVTYSPTVEGSDTGRVIIMSNSTFTPRADVILSGTAIGVPRFSTIVDSLVRTVEGGVRDSISFHMRNVGTTTGNYSARAIMYPRTAFLGKTGGPLMIPVTVEKASTTQTRAQDSDDLPAFGNIPATTGTSLSPAATTSLQQVPELIYYKFNEAGGNATQNFANPGVGTNPAPVLGLTMGGTGQFGSALIGNGGSSTSNYVNTGWTTALGTGSWTVSMWLNNLPVGQTTLYYLFGDNTASSFRSFLNGAAGAGNVTLRMTGLSDLIVTGVAPGPTVVTYVYDASVNQVRAYKNGVQVATASATLNINGTGVTPFKVGGYSTSTALPTGGLMDEFRLYNRALTAGEIAATWNTELGRAAWLSVQPTEGTLAVGDSALMRAYLDATDSSIYSDPGNYYGRIEVVAMNSTLADTLRIPARMFVIPPAGARIAVEPDSLDFGDVEIGESRTLSVLVRNIGASTLTVTGTTMSDTSFSANPTSFTLSSLDTQRVNVMFRAPTPGAIRSGTMQFVSNDPLAPSVGLRGRSVGIAHIAVRPDSFFFSVALGDSIDGTLQIRNTGLDVLTYRGRVQGSGTDNVGSTQNSLATSSGLMRGGVVEVATTTRLREIRSWLNITASRELRFVVYENTTGTSFSKIFESAVPSSGTGTQWYSSGPMGLELEVGKRYAIGVNWAALSGLTYYWQSSAPVPVPISFGTITGGLAQTVFPPPQTITQGASSSLYYTQVITAQYPWMNVITGDSGAIAVGDSAVLTFRVWTDQLQTGTAEGALEVLSNDPTAPTVVVPVVVDVLTGIASAERQIPETWELHQNYPNPFNPTTTIKYGLPVDATVTLRVFNILGQEVATLVNEIQRAGYYRMSWDGRSATGAQIASGVYFFRIDAVPANGTQHFSQVRKMMLIK